MTPAHPTQLNILVIDEELPFPLNSGKRIRSFNLLQRLAKRHRITYLARRNADPQEAIHAAEALRQTGITPLVVDRAIPAKSGPAFYVRLALNLLSKLPYSVWTHASPQLRDEVRQVLAREPFDLIHCEWTPYVELMRKLCGVPVVASAHNIESQIWQRYFENEPSGLKRAYIHHQYKKYCRFEHWAFSRADQVVFVSDQDERLARQSFAAQRTCVVENGVDVQSFQPVFEGRDPYQLLMMGSLDWRPNLDGIEQFLKTVYPTLRAAEPRVRLVVIGRNPQSNWAEWVRSHPAVELHANVPDVRPHVARAGCLVVPLRIGGGSRLKILEAAASGLPVASTRVGAEGLALEPGIHYAGSDAIESLGPAVLESVRNPVLARKRAVAARDVMVQQYDWDILAERLAACWLACAHAQNVDKDNEVAAA